MKMAAGPVGGGAPAVRVRQDDTAGLCAACPPLLNTPSTITQNDCAHRRGQEQYDGNRRNGQSYS